MPRACPLRNAPQETETAGASGDIDNSEENFIDTGFHALATTTVEGEVSSEQQRDNHDSTSTSTTSSRNASGLHSNITAGRARAAESYAGGTVGNAGIHDNDNDNDGEDGQGDLEVEEEEDFGEVELVVTQDGGVVPVTSAVETKPAAVDLSAGTTAALVTASATPGGKRGARCKTRESAEQGLVRRAVKGKATAVAAVAGVMTVGAADARESSKASSLEMDQPRRKVCEGRVGVDDGAVCAREGVKDEVGGQGGGGVGRGEEEAIVSLAPDVVLTLSDDVLHRTMLFLHPEDILECRAVSSRWEFPGHEAVFEGLCRRTYLAQVCCVCARIGNRRHPLVSSCNCSWQRGTAHLVSKRGTEKQARLLSGSAYTAAAAPWLSRIFSCVVCLVEEKRVKPLGTCFIKVLVGNLLTPRLRTGTCPWTPNLMCYFYHTRNMRVICRLHAGLGDVCFARALRPPLTTAAPFFLRLCQSAKKLLNVQRWRSWQRMFKFRPRLRDTGLYR